MNDGNGGGQMAAATKTGRFEARLTDEQRMVLERAASVAGRSLSDFVIGSALRAAEETLRAEDAPTVTLSARDSLSFAQALLNAQPADERLVEAGRRARTLVRPL